MSIRSLVGDCRALLPQEGHSRRQAGFNDRFFDVSESSDMPEKRAFRNSDLFLDSLGPVTDGDGTIIALDVFADVSAA